MCVCVSERNEREGGGGCCCVGWVACGACVAEARASELRCGVGWGAAVGDVRVSEVSVGVGEGCGRVCRCVRE